MKLKNISERIALTWAAVIISFTLVGQYYEVTPGPLAAIAVLCVFGIVVTSRLHASVLGSAREQIEVYLRDPSKGMPEPPPPQELVPFFEFIIRAQSSYAEDSRRQAAQRAAREAHDAALFAAMSALDSDTSLEARFGAMLAPLASHLGSDATGYFHVEHAGMPARLVVWKGTAPSMPERCVAASPMEEAMVAGKVGWVPSVSADWVPAALRVWALENGLQSAWFAPALHGTRLTGFVACFSKQARERAEVQEQWLLSLARPMGLAQASSELHKKVAAESTEAQTVNEFMLVVGRSLDVQEACGRILTLLQRLVPHARGAVLLADGEEAFEVVAPSYPGEDGYFVGSRLLRAGSCAQAAMVSRTLQIAGELGSGEGHEDDALLVDDGFKSRLALPIIASGRSLGCIYLVARTKDAFSAAQVTPIRDALEVVATSLDLLRQNQQLGRALAQQAPSAGAGFFSTAVGHELRSEMSVFVTNLEGLAGALDGTPGAAANSLLQRARQVLLLLDGVHDLELGDAESRALRAEEMLLGDAIRETEAGLQTQLAERELNVFWDVPEGLPPLVADPQRFRSLLFQWLSYTVATCPASSQLHFRASLLPASWVKDKGADFVPPQLVNRLEPGVDQLVLTLLDEAEAPSVEMLGQLFAEAGLGGDGSDPRTRLVYFKQMVELHKGHVWAEVGPQGKGLRIGAVLPQVSMDKLTFINHVARCVRDARESMVCLSLIAVGFAQKSQLRIGLGDSQYYRAVKELEAVIRHTIREPIDTIRRYHGADVLVVFARTDRAGANRIVERLQASLGQVQWKVLPSAPAIEMRTVTYPDEEQKPEGMVALLEPATRTSPLRLP